MTYRDELDYKPLYHRRVFEDDKGLYVRWYGRIMRIKPSTYADGDIVGVVFPARQRNVFLPVEFLHIEAVRPGYKPDADCVWECEVYRTVSGKKHDQEVMEDSPTEPEPTTELVPALGDDTLESQSYSAIAVIENWKLGYHLGVALESIYYAGRKHSLDPERLRMLDNAIWHLERVKNLDY